MIGLMAMAVAGEASAVITSCRGEVWLNDLPFDCAGAAGRPMAITDRIETGIDGAVQLVDRTLIVIDVGPGGRWPDPAGKGRDTPKPPTDGRYAWSNAVMRYFEEVLLGSSAGDPFKYGASPFEMRVLGDVHLDIRDSVLRWEGPPGESWIVRAARSGGEASDPIVVNLPEVDVAKLLQPSSRERTLEVIAVDHPLAASVAQFRGPVEGFADIPGVNGAWQVEVVYRRRVEQDLEVTSCPDPSPMACAAWLWENGELEESRAQLEMALGSGPPESVRLRASGFTPVIP